MIIAAAAGLGALLVNALGLGDDSRSVTLATGFLLGLFGLALAALVLGLTGHFDRGLLRGLLAALAVAGAAAIRRRPRPDYSAVWHDGVARWAVTAACALLAIPFVMAFVPEGFYDALVYHLGAPHTYLSEGRIVQLPHSHAAFPQLASMVYAWGLSWSGDAATKLVHAALLTVVALLWAGYGARRGEGPAGALAALFIAATPMMQMAAWTSGSDLFAAAYVSAAAVAVLRFQESPAERPAWRRLMLAGVLAGCALGSKYTAAPGVFALWLAVTIDDTPGRARRVALFAMAVALAFAPWAAKNALIDGNPVYPFLRDLLGGAPMDAWRVELLRRSGSGPVVAPWEWPAQIWTWFVRDHRSMGYLGPLFLALAPLSITGWRQPGRRRETRFWLVFAVTALTVGTLMTRHTRLLIPVFATLAWPLALGFMRLWASSPARPRLAMLMLAGLLVWAQTVGTFSVIDRAFRPRRALLGVEDRAAFVMNDHPGLAPNPADAIFPAIRKGERPGDRLLLVGDEKAYPVPGRVLYSGAFDTGPLVAVCNAAGSAKEALRGLQALGVTRLLVNVAEADRLGRYGLFGFSEHGLGVLSGLWQDHAFFEEGMRVQDGAGRQNVLILARLSAETVPEGSRLPDPFLGLYDAYELPRRGVTTSEGMVRFYRGMAARFPGVQVFRRRVELLQADQKKTEERPARRT